MTITVVMNSWKRQNNIPQIISSIRDSDLVNEIIIWDNNPDIDFKLRKDNHKVKIINSNTDLGLSTRWAMGLFAKNDCIMTQDDDHLILPSEIAKLYSGWKKNTKSMHGVSGRNPGQNNRYANAVTEGEAEMVMTGFAMLHKEYCLKYFEALAGFKLIYGPELIDIINTHGDDLFMSYLILSLSKRMNMIHKNIEYKEIAGAHDHTALHMRPGHYKKREQLMHSLQKHFNIPLNT